MTMRPKHNCTSCGISIRRLDQAKLHEDLKCIICIGCHTKYSETFLKVDNLQIESKLNVVKSLAHDTRCRWCCSETNPLIPCTGDRGKRLDCRKSFCYACIKRNASQDYVLRVFNLTNNLMKKADVYWNCFICSRSKMTKLQKEAEEFIQELTNFEATNKRSMTPSARDDCEIIVIDSDEDQGDKRATNEDGPDIFVDSRSDLDDNTVNQPPYNDKHLPPQNDDQQVIDDPMMEDSINSSGQDSLRAEDRRESYRSRDWYIANHIIKESNLEFRVGWVGYSDFFDTPEPVEFVLANPGKLASYLRRIKSENLDKFDMMIKMAPELAEACRGPETSFSNTEQAKTGVKMKRRLRIGHSQGHSSPLRRQLESSSSSAVHVDIIKRESIIHKMPSDRQVSMRPRAVFPILLSRLGHLTIPGFECDPKLYSLPCFAEASREAIEELNINQTIHLVLSSSNSVRGSRGPRGPLTYFGAHAKHKNGIEAIMGCGSEVNTSVAAFRVKFNGHPEADNFLASEVLKVDAMAVWRYIETIRQTEPHRIGLWRGRNSSFHKIYTSKNWRDSLPFVESKERIRLLPRK